MGTAGQAVAAVEGEQATPLWFSDNPSKRWAEKFFLAYSPVWIVIMAAVMWLRIPARLGDFGFLVLGLVVATPLVLVPAIFRDERDLGRAWHQTYWFKANLYIAIFNFTANYFSSEYFFDVLGMVYNYPTISLNLDATLVGSGEQQVPILMYLLTQAYFMMYHTTAVIVLRRIRTGRLGVASWLWPVVVVAVAYAWAWIETKSMANPLIASQFYYKDMERMLAYGSLFYGLYFIASFPIFYWLDERKSDNWSILVTSAAACTAGLIMLFLLDFATKIFGTL